MSKHEETPAKWNARWDAVMMNNYGTPPVQLSHGQASVVTDCDGRDYVDFLAGIAVNSLGHAHPGVVSAVTEQMKQLGHVSNLFSHEPGVELAERLADRVAAAAGSTREKLNVRVAFCNSGAESNEMAFKLARLTGKRRILAAVNGFHGRTMGALAMTGQPAKRDIFAPLPGGVEFFPFNDGDYLKKLIDVQPDQVAAVIVEPIQGETGVIPATKEFLQTVREETKRVGALMMCDEVQTGNGRTGTYFAYEDAGIVPDVVTTAKGLAAGLPIGACITTGAASKLFTPGVHGSTFAGNPVVTAAAGVVQNEIDGGLMDNVHQRSQQLIDGLTAIDGIAEVRGRGLMLGAVLSQANAKDIAAQALKNGVIVNAPSDSVLRFTPALNISADEVATGLERVKAAVADA